MEYKFVLHKSRLSKHILLGIIFLFITVSIKSQEKNFENEVEELNYYSKNIEHHLNKSLDSAEYYVEKGEELCENIEEYIKRPNSDTAKANACANFFANKGSVEFAKVNYLEALKSFYTAIGICKQTNELKSLGYNYSNVSSIFRQINDGQEALKYAQKAMLIFESNGGDDEGLAAASYNLGVIKKDFKRYEEAKHYTEKALSLYSTLKNYFRQAQSLNLLALVAKSLEDTVASINHYDESLRLFKKIDYLPGQANVLNNLGSLYEEMGEIEKAQDYLMQSHEISKNLNHQRGEAFSKVNLAKIWMRKNRINVAVDSAYRAFEIGKNIGEIEVVEKATNLLIDAYKQKGDFKNAFRVQELFIETKDALQQQKDDQISLQESIRFEIEKEILLQQKEAEKEESLGELRKDREKILITASGVIIITLLSLLIFGYYQLKNTRQKNTEIRKQSEERKLLLQEVHHRVKNNFQIVSSLLRLQYYTLDNKEFQSIFEEAIMRINSMSTVHDIIYRQEAFSSIDANDYFEKLIAELKRLTEKEIEIETDVSVKIEEIELLIHLGIITNELFINSLKYGFTEEISNPKIKITLEKLGDDFALNYLENGKGISPEKYKTSFGMELIETIMEQHNGIVSVLNNKDWSTHVRVVFTPNI